MTTVTERKSDLAVVLGFLIAVCALAAWRGWQGARVAAIIAAIIGAGLSVAIIVAARRPPYEVRVAYDRIEWGRSGECRTAIERDQSGALRFSRAPRIGSPWVLCPRDRPEHLGISLMGFTPAEIRRVCEQVGWTFDQSLFADPG